jgi:ribonuclease HI
MKQKELTGVFALYTDGASRGNPGEAGAGAVILDGQGEELAARSFYLGKCSNNVAEYKALIFGLQAALELGCRQLEIFLDSQLIVRQVQGQYKVKNAGLKPLFAQVKQLLAKLNSFTISHVPRNENKRADELANRGIDDKNL